jgi:CTP synthase (UTP-ammonia lyase)
VTAPRLALVGDRSPSVLAHQRIPTILTALAGPGGPPVDATWWHSSELGDDVDLSGFDGIWVLPGSPYANQDGVLRAIATARAGGIPFLGTCGGFQHVVLELARNEAGLVSASHGEDDPTAAEQLLIPMACALLDQEERVTVEPGTLAARILGAGPRTERYFCGFAVNEAYVPALVAAGLVVAGRDDAGAVRLGELRDHPFFIGSLFQPELSSDADHVHPLIRAFYAAATEHAAVAAVTAG